MSIGTKQVLKYSLLPGILPQVKDLCFNGFSHVAFFIALVYRAVGLLGPAHPYTNPVNLGRFGVSHVVREAASGLVFDRQHIDQVIIFITSIIGFILMFIQIGMICFALSVTTAKASGLGDWYGSFFLTDDPTHDVAFILMDRTFGVQGVFGSCVEQGVPCGLDVQTNASYGGVAGQGFPTSFHRQLHGLFHFYNVGLLAVGFILLMYFSVTIVAETAQSGTPFGRRFNGAWAPVRLLLAIGALTPLTHGLNGAQLVTLHVAKWGSGVATNGWNLFLDSLEDGWTAMGDEQSLVARAKGPSLNTLPEFMFVASLCARAEFQLNDRNIRAWVVGGPTPQTFAGNDWDTAVQYSLNNGLKQIIIRFGEWDHVNYGDYSSNVRPVCGELHLPIKSYDDGGVDRAEWASRFIQVSYFYLVSAMWVDADGTSVGSGTVFQDWRDAVARRMLPTAEKDAFAEPIPSSLDVRAVMLSLNCAVAWNDPAACANASASAGDFFVGQGGSAVSDYDSSWMGRARELQIDLGRWKDPYMHRLGWGGAAIWYNKIAYMNGAMVAAANGAPVAHLYPEVMEKVREKRREAENAIDSQTRFNPVLADKTTVKFDRDEDQYIAFALYYGQSLWFEGYEKPSGNAFLDTIAAIFGLTGLFSIRDNMDIHPLAQLAAVGRSLVESAVMNLGFSFGAGVVGGLANILNQGLVATVGMAAASFSGKIAMMGMSLGFILFYIIPFLPFIHFMFAVGGWVKAVFEAMVGVPLWALAHIRIDGEGIPGPSGMNGYFLMLDILIRPILIIIGLVGGVLIFATQVRVLNEIWDLVTSNLTGYDYGNQSAATTTSSGAPFRSGTTEFIRSGADQLFYTIIYTIVVYMFATSSFKLVSLIPNYILRWLNASVSTFGEHEDDPAGSLVQYAFMGSQLMTSGGQQALSGLMGRNS